MTPTPDTPDAATVAANKLWDDFDNWNTKSEAIPHIADIIRTAYAPIIARAQQADKLAEAVERANGLLRRIPLVDSNKVRLKDKSCNAVADLIDEALAAYRAATSAHAEKKEGQG